MQMNNCRCNCKHKCQCKFEFKKTNSDNAHIGPKIKGCFLFIWAHLLFLTWLVLKSNMPIIILLAALCITVISIYLHVVLMQDYFFLKTHANCKDFRKDIRLLEHLLPERMKKNDK